MDEDQGFRTVWGGVLAAAEACMVWSFATYQVLVPYFIAVSALLFIVFYLLGEARERYFDMCLRIVLAFLAGFALYSILSRVLVWQYFGQIGATPLSDTYMRWGNAPVWECISGIVRDVRDVALARVLVFSRYYIFMTPAFMALAIAQGKKTGKKQYPLLILGVLIFVGSPFLLSAVLGNLVVIRACLVYPAVFAATVGLIPVLLSERFPQKHFLKWAAVALSGIMLCSQISISNRYAELVHATAEADVRFAHEIYMKKQEVLSEYGIGNGDWVPIVFAGKRRPEFPGCYIEPNHATGISFFEIDSGHVDGTGRIARMMCSTGMKTAEPSIEQFEQGMEDAKAMPVWPLEGSCRYNEELQMIVVKLSDDAE